MISLVVCVCVCVLVGDYICCIYYEHVNLHSDTVVLHHCNNNNNNKALSINFSLFNCLRGVTRPTVCPH